MIRNHNKRLFVSLFLVLFVICIVIVFVYFFIINSSSNQAEKAVAKFYAYERNGEFAESWEMFHPLMKERFQKADYLQDRVHVFFHHFGVNTFTYTIEDTERIRNWQLEEDAEPIDKVYKVTVCQYFQGIYGNFTIVQNVYATKLDGEWTVLWDYKKTKTAS